MKIVIGNDHRGYHLKQLIINHLNNIGMETLDVGCFNEEPANHIEFGIKVGEKIAKEQATYGILICGSGIGISIAANKVKGIRCALVSNEKEAELTRAHNNANVVAISAVIEDEKAIAIVDAFLTSPFLGGKYQERIDVLNHYEKKGRLK